MKQNNVLIVGATIQSAGIGGVTVHVQRLLQWLDVKQFDYSLCDYKSLSLIEQFKEIRLHRVVHIHISNPFVKLVYTVICRLVGTETILTNHGNIGRYSRLKNLMEQWSIRLCKIPILLNLESFKSAIHLNADSVLLSAFIPPIDDGSIPAYVEDSIVQMKSEGKIIVAANAFARAFTDNGEEIYGVDFIVRYFKNKSDYCVYLSDPSGQYGEYYKKEQLDNILFLSEQHSFYKLLTLSDIMLRPTATDGDSISVREGLYLGKQVIATDRVDRPNGVILFHYNDSDSLDSALNSGIVTNHAWKINDNVVESLIALYNKLQQSSSQC